MKLYIRLYVYPIYIRNKKKMKKNMKAKKKKEKKVIFGFGNYFENVTGEEHQRITKLNFVYIITYKYKNTCFYVKTYSLISKNGTCHIYVYWKE